MKKLIQLLKCLLLLVSYIHIANASCTDYQFWLRCTLLVCNQTPCCQQCICISSLFGIKYQLYPGDTYYCDNKSTPTKCVSPYLGSSSITETTCSQCVDGYFLSGSTLCIQCNTLCSTCKSSQNNCTACSNSALQIPECVCPLGQGKIATVCTSCTLPCASCQTTVTTCTACYDSDYRTVDNNQCICMDGYVDISGVCLQCNSPCATCINTQNECVTCLDTTKIADSNGNCVCDTNYIEISGACIQCNETCGTCSGSIDNCLTCINTTDLQLNNDGTCTCINNGSWITASSTCEVCTPPCATCQTTITTCLSCTDSNQILQTDNTCQCQNGYYVDPSDSTRCDQCSLNCYTCDNLGCLSCNLNDSNQYLDSYTCKCHNGYFLQTTTLSQCIQCITGCDICNDTVICSQCSDGYYLNSNICLQCSQNCKTCQTNYNYCLTCNSNSSLDSNNICICDQGYYEQNGICNACLQPCLYCSSQILCTQCNYITDLNLIDDWCYCIDGKYYDSNDNACNQCDSKCLTCKYKSTYCLTCDSLLNRIFSSNECVCQDNFYQNSNNLCESCKSLNAKSVESCKYKDCTDGIWTYGEGCDDGNSNIRDGCTNCQIDDGFTCINIILEQSICYQCPTNCIDCTYDQNTLSYNCQTAQSGYFIYENQAAKCSDRCTNCNLNATNCTSCKYININTNSNELNCKLCNELQGYYTNTITMTCYTICGDQLLADIEECDDGNNIDGDGCDSQCKLETSYVCKNGICIIPNYPIPSIIEIGQNQLYNSKRQVKIQYDQLLKLENTFNLLDLITPQIFVNESEIQINYQITQDLLLQENENNIYNLTALIEFDLVDSLTNGIFTLNYINISSIINNQMYQQQESKISLELTNYIFISEEEKALTESSIQSTYYILYIMIVILIVGILFGGTEIYYNLLDTLQQFSYLKYINIEFPFNLEQYFDSMQFAQVTIVQDSLNLEDYTEQQFQFNFQDNDNNIPQKIKNDGYTGCFAINITSIFTAWFIGLFIFLIAKIIFNKILKYRISITHNNLKSTYYLKYKIFIYTIKEIIIVTLNTILCEFFFSGIYRIIISSANEFAFFLNLSLQSTQFNLKQNVFLNFSFLLTIFSFFIYILFIYFSFIVIDQKQYTIKSEKYQQKFGSIFEGVKLQNHSILYNPLLLIKKYLFMSAIIFLYDNPMFQVINTLLLTLLTSCYIIIFNPVQDKLELLKQCSCEISLTITSFLLTLLCFDSDNKEFSEFIKTLIGWGVISSQLLALVIQLITNVLQQWKYLYNNYKPVRKFIDLIKNNCNSKQKLINQQTPKIFEELQLNQLNHQTL